MPFNIMYISFFFSIKFIKNILLNIFSRVERILKFEGLANSLEMDFIPKLRERLLSI